jgi:hypothetical protein
MLNIGQFVLRGVRVCLFQSEGIACGGSLYYRLQVEVELCMLKLSILVLYCIIWTWQSAG